MNIIDIQDQLKNFSEDQLIREMQMPSGNAPQFLVLTEIQRRKRVRDDFTKRQAAQEPTVAQEAVAAAGVPQSGIAGMSEAMAPQSTSSDGIGTIMPQSMRQAVPQQLPSPTEPPIEMRSGGLMAYGQELSQRMSQDKIDPFLDEVEQMANNRFGVGAMGNITLGPVKHDLSRPSLFRVPNETPNLQKPYYENQVQGIRGGPNQAYPVMPQPSMPTSGKGGGPLFGSLVGNIAGNAITAVPFAEGGVVKAANGLPLGLRQFNPGNLRAGAGFLGETGVNDGYATFESDDYGLRALARNLNTYSSKHGINTVRGLVSRYAPKFENQDSFENYINKVSRDLGVDPDEEIDISAMRGKLMPSIIGFEQGRQPYSQGQIDRAIAASGTDDPEKVKEMFSQPIDVSDGPWNINRRQVATTTNAVSPTAGPTLSQISEMIKQQQGLGLSPQSAMQKMSAESQEKTAAETEAREAAANAANAALADQTASGEPITQEDDFVSPDDMSTMSPTEIEVWDAGNELGSANSDVKKTQEALKNNPTPENHKKAVDAQKRQEEAQKAHNNATKKLEEEGKRESDEQKRAREAAEAAKRGEPLPSTLDDEKAKKEADEKKKKDEESKKAQQQINIGAGQETYNVGSIESEILKMQKQLQKDRETDKWLAIAQAGLALMSSKEPTLLGAAGEAGVEGLKAYREAQDRYQEGVIDLINARAKLRGSKDGELTKNQMLSQAKSLFDLAQMAETPQERDRMIAEAQRLQRRALYGGTGIYNVADAS